MYVSLGVRGLLFVAVFALFFQAPLAARAQDAVELQRRATARTLFAEGVAFMQEQSWAEAADRFRRTLELHPTPVVAFNLGSSLVELNHFVEAAEHLRMTGRFPGADPEVSQEAAALLSEIEPRIGRLRVVVADAPADAHVEHNGQVLTRAQMGIDAPADPGIHVVRLVRGRESLDERTVQLADGARETVTLTAESSGISAVAAARTVVEETHAPTDPGSSRDEGGGEVWSEWWFWVLVGALAVGAGVGIGLGVALSNDGQGSVEIVPGDLMPEILRVGGGTP